MSVTLRSRENGDGTTTLYLDIYNNGERKYEFLNNLKLCKAANPADRLTNKENNAAAKKIAVQRAQQLQLSDYSMVTDLGKKTKVVEWMQAYIDVYKKQDKRNMQGALNKFSAFLVEDNKTGLTFGPLTELIISDYQDYLRRHSTGEGASSYFNRFKKMVKNAYRQKLILTNPAAEVRTVTGNAKKRDTLTIEEIQLLANTPTESTEVRKAFLFSCVTGLRWAEVYGLKWSKVNMQNKYIDVLQGKGEKYKRVSLNEVALILIEEQGDPKALVFNLPTANGANKSVKAWVKRAGITKKITWHNARHSFGTNLIYYGADATTARNLLGHSSLKYTQRYVAESKELKERATDTLKFNV